MVNEEHYGAPEGETSGETPQSDWGNGSASGLEDEWRQMMSTHGQEGALPDWEPVPMGDIRPIGLSVPTDRTSIIPEVKKEILFYRQMTLPVVIRLLHAREDRELPVFSIQESAQEVLAEFEELLSQANQEVSVFEAEHLGEDEFNGELGASEAAHELALTEVMAAEAIHAKRENEAQSLLAGTLPISIGILSGSRSLKTVLPALTQANARLVRGLFHASPKAREVFGLLPSIHRRVIAGLKASSARRIRLTPAFTHRLLTAQTVKTLTSPAMAGRALVRNRAIREKTMPPCGGGGGTY